MSEIAGGTVLVTGSAQGIGASIASRFKNEGAFVIGADRNPTIGVDEQLLIDLAEPESWPNLPKVDILICAAGICLTHPFAESGVSSWIKTLNVNLVSAAELSRRLIPHMVEVGAGTIIHISSVSGFLPKLDQVEYGASKAALISLTRSLAAIYGPLGIRVNAIAPGLIDTPLTDQIRMIRGEASLIDAISRTPAGRLGLPEEIANVACFLAGPDAAFIHGQVINVDGGLLMR